MYTYVAFHYIICQSFCALFFIHQTEIEFVLANLQLLACRLSTSNVICISNSQSQTPCLTSQDV